MKERKGGRARRDHKKSGAWSFKHSSVQGRTSVCHGMTGRREKKQEQKGAGGETTGEDNSRDSGEEPEKGPIAGI